MEIRPMSDVCKVGALLAALLVWPPVLQLLWLKYSATQILWVLCVYVCVFDILITGILLIWKLLNFSYADVMIYLG